jgi:hypothetical protein
MLKIVSSTCVLLHIFRIWYFRNCFRTYEIFSKIIFIIIFFAIITYVIDFKIIFLYHLSPPCFFLKTWRTYKSQEKKYTFTDRFTCLAKPCYVVTLHNTPQSVATWPTGRHYAGRRDPRLAAYISCFVCMEIWNWGHYSRIIVVNIMVIIAAPAIKWAFYYYPSSLLYLETFPSGLAYCTFIHVHGWYRSQLPARASVGDGLMIVLLAAPDGGPVVGPGEAPVGAPYVS